MVIYQSGDWNSLLRMATLLIFSHEKQFKRVMFVCFSPGGLHVWPEDPVYIGSVLGPAAVALLAGARPGRLDGGVMGTALPSALCPHTMVPQYTLPGECFY